MNLASDAAGTLGEDGAFWVSMASRVRSKSNYRNSKKAAGWRELSGFSAAVAAQVRAHRPENWVLPEHDVAVKDRPGAVVVLMARTTLDAGNLSKSILDALEGVLWFTDAEVKVVTEAVDRGRSNPGLAMAFAQVPPGSGLRDALVRSSWLGDELLSALERASGTARG